MSLVVLDSSTLVGLLSPSDALHRGSRRAVMEWESEGAGFVISVVSWSEVLTGALRQGRVDEPGLRSLVESVTDDVVPASMAIASAAAELRARDAGLRTPGALIAATARHLEADRLVTGDRKLKRVDRQLVQVVTP